MSKKYSKKIVSNSFTDVIPYYKYESKDAGWRDGLVSGNGENGVLCTCAPYSETLIYQNMYFILPVNQPRVVPPEVTKELHEARQSVINYDDTWNVNNRKRTTLYSFHPGHQIRLSMQKEELLDYTRETNFETAEIIVKYTDQNGTWIRRTFTSREDNLTITKITKSDSGTKIKVDILIDDIASMKKCSKAVLNNNGLLTNENLQYKKLIDEECFYISMVAHYPFYEASELAEGGYSGVTRVVVNGGSKKKILGADTNEAFNVGKEKNPFIRITDSDEIYLITKNARTHHLGKSSDFAAMQHYDIVNELQTDIEKIIQKYTDDRGCFSYETALEPHAKKQAHLYNGVSFCLGSDEGKDAFNEDLLIKQKNCKNLLDALVERAYNQGRYSMICCLGSSVPRLCGLWTGEWYPGWNASYTMDANVNIQTSGMNTGNVYDASLGYIYFILRQIKDWEVNATMVYGMKDALLAPVNTDGDSAILVEYDKNYPFQYWNAGASWMIIPIYEIWQCYGNLKIPVIDKISHQYQQESLDLVQDILYMLLKKVGNFWDQLCTPEYYTDISGKASYQEGKKELIEGEKYIIIPSYSPENKPKGYNSAITANTTMDIAAARDVINMIINLENEFKQNGHKNDLERWEKLLNHLPEYKYDNTGALCEWAMNEYVENNEHPHISHLYSAWPAYETQNNDMLTVACNIAIANRNKENEGKPDVVASHGWVHKALVAARLKNSESAYQLLSTLMDSDIFFSSFMTDHNTDRGEVYCTDTIHGIVGIINEMLLFSNTNEIELLPALPKEWKEGTIKGLIARTNAQVTLIDWNLKEKKVISSIRSNINQKIRIKCRIGGDLFYTSNGLVYHNGDEVSWNANEELTIEFKL